MVYAVTIDKSGQLNTIKMREVSEHELYKKCGFKTSTDFSLRHTWTTVSKSDTTYISLYAKNKSRTANFENKYEFPPPVDVELYYGTCLLIAYATNDVVDGPPHRYISLTIDTWQKVYNKLYGGFETLADSELSDALEIDELAIVDKSKLTKSGYLKDGFVVDDSSAEDASDLESDISSISDDDISEVIDIPVSAKNKRKSKISFVKSIPIVFEKLKLEEFV
jgi:hypothetical protein